MKKNNQCKIMRFKLWLPGIFLGLALGFTSGQPALALDFPITVLPVRGIPYVENFEDNEIGEQPTGWTDETDDESYNAEIEIVDWSIAKVAKVHEDVWFGLVLSPLMALDVNEFNKIRVIVTEVDPASSFRVHVQEEGHDSTEIFIGTEPGTYEGDMPAAWSGIKAFKVKLVVESQNDETGYGLGTSFDKIEIY